MAIPQEINQRGERRMKHTLDLESARDCLEVLTPIFERTKDNEEAPPLFVEEFGGLINFLQVSVRSELPEIVIPERYHRIYDSAAKTLIIAAVTELLRGEN